MKTSLSWIVLSLCVLVRADIEDDFRGLYQIYSDFKFNLDQAEEDHLKATASHGASFDCPASVSPEKPTSVHRLRPGDFDVVAAVGDSLSTAYAADAKLFLPVMLNYWGVSASIGGDQSVETVGTVPNILRKYNPDIIGFSTGDGVVFTQPKNKGYNHAVVGARARALPEQARKLVKHLLDDPAIDMKNDWKFVTLFIGGNDLCSGCSNEDSLPEVYLTYIDEALQILHDEVPRVLVNLVGVMNAYMLSELKGSLKCNLVHSIVCKCLNKDGGQEEVAKRGKEYQMVVEEHIKSGKFDDKEDFTVVYQPFFHETAIPRTEDGKADTSYFASDCFHFSQKGHAAQATANWNGLFEPVGSKRVEWVPGEALNCPSQDFPYIYTNVNSKAETDNPQGLPRDDFLNAPQGGGVDIQENQNGLSTESIIIIVGLVCGLVAFVLVVAFGSLLITKHRCRSSANSSYEKL